jgi:hypothetical protein
MISALTSAPKAQSGFLQFKPFGQACPSVDPKEKRFSLRLGEKKGKLELTDTAISIGAFQSVLNGTARVLRRERRKI